MEQERGFSSRDRLMLIFILDVRATLMEAYGATIYNSAVLWENVGIGAFDAALFALNIFGIEAEVEGRRGLKIANISDIILGGYFAIAGSLAFVHLLGGNGQMSVVDGRGTAFTALVVAAVNAGCAWWLRPSHEVNGQSARLKLWVGTATNLSAIGAGGLIHLKGWYWVDSFVTGLVAAGVVVTVILALLGRRKPVVLNVFPDIDGEIPLGI
jgi:Co/Zn/Cd efflux system component